MWNKVKKTFGMGGDVDVNPEVTLPEEEEEVDEFALSKTMMDSYFGFLDNNAKDLYLSDLLVFRAKKDLAKRHSYVMGVPDKNTESMELIEEAGFYDFLKDKPYYSKLPFKKNILKWLPNVEDLSEMNLGTEGMTDKPKKDKEEGILGNEQTDQALDQFTNAVEGFKMKPGLDSASLTVPLGNDDKITAKLNYKTGEGKKIPGGKISLIKYF